MKTINDYLEEFEEEICGIDSSNAFVSQYLSKEQADFKKFLRSSLLNMLEEIGEEIDGFLLCDWSGEVEVEQEIQRLKLQIISKLKQ